jgi:hypothetical protein
VADAGLEGVNGPLGRVDPAAFLEHRFYLLGRAAAEPEVIAELSVKEPAYMHSFGLTERWLVLAEFPLVVNPASIPLSGRPYIENYKWKPELGTKVTLIDRQTGEATGPFETDPFFSFHHANAYEENGSVVVDACTYADAQIVEDLYLDRLRDGKPADRGDLRRFRIDVGSGAVSNEQLAEGLELPRINYGRNNERPYRYVWGVDAKSGWLDAIVKADVDAGSTTEWAHTAERGFPGDREAIRIVELDGEHVGSIGLSDEGDGEAAIRWVVLSPEVRGNGLGGDCSARCSRSRKITAIGGSGSRPSAIYRPPRTSTASTASWSPLPIPPRAGDGSRSPSSATSWSSRPARD